MNTWIRRSFGAEGLTQHPVGPYLPKIQERFGGTVILCIDISGSMCGTRLTKAVEGGHRFVRDALRAHYHVGIVLWHHDIGDTLPPTRDERKLTAFLDGATCSGGNDITPTLRACHKWLRERPVTTDRVVVIFGDGDLGDRTRAIESAAVLRADNIRILTVGLGDQAARALDEISTETKDTPHTATPETITSSIALMAKGLGRRSR